MPEKGDGSILVSPGGSGKTSTFASGSGHILDEESIMRLKWPMCDEHFNNPEMKSAWFQVCTPILEKVICEGYTVAMSVSMSKKISLWSHVMYAGKRIIVVIIPEETHIKQVFKRALTRGSDPSSLLEKMSSERSFCRMVSKLNPRTELRECLLSQVKL
jgi:hypothetical protein